MRLHVREVMLLSGVLCGAAGSVAEVLPAGFPMRQGPLLLCHAEDLTKVDMPVADREWLCRFRLIVTNGYGIPAPHVATALRAHGCRLFHYFWANGFTANESRSTSLPDGVWRQELLRTHPEWLLSPESLEGPPGTPPSYYYDFASSELLTYLARQISTIRAAEGYDGTFFDYAGAYALPEAVAELWRRIHPDLLYDAALAGFFRALRTADPRTLIFTNQAVRGDPELLPTVDYDMVESYGTSFAWGPVVKVDGEGLPLSYRRPWEGPGGIKAVMAPVMARLRTGAPRGSLFCLDYMRPVLVREGGEWQQGVDTGAVYYSYCAAALWGLNASCSGWYGQEYRGPLYFADLGKPLGEGPVELEGVVVREYERGLVVLLREARAAEVTYRLQANSGVRLYSLMDEKTIGTGDGAVTLRLRPTRVALADAPQPVGRVYLKTN